MHRSVIVYRRVLCYNRSTHPACAMRPNPRAPYIYQRTTYPPTHKGGLLMAQTKKALVLSGGGGRGAYHIGVLEALVERGWMEDGQGPDIIAGTSIGAINAAALASGLTVGELKRRWLAMHTEEVHRLSNDLPAAARPLLRFMLRSVLTSEAHGGAHDTLPAEERRSEERR